MESTLRNSNEIICKHRKLPLHVPGKVFRESGRSVKLYNILYIVNMKSVSHMVRPNKKVCVFLVSRPSLFFPSDPKTFYCVWVSNHQNLEIDSYVFLLKLVKAVWWLVSYACKALQYQWLGRGFCQMGHFQLFSMILKFSMGHFLSFYTGFYGPFSKLMGLSCMAPCLPNHWYSICM